MYPEIMWVQMWKECHRTSDKANCHFPGPQGCTDTARVFPGQGAKGQLELEPTLLSVYSEFPSRTPVSVPRTMTTGPKCPQKTNKLNFPSAGQERTCGVCVCKG